MGWLILVMLHPWQPASGQEMGGGFQTQVVLLVSDVSSFEGIYDHKSLTAQGKQRDGEVAGKNRHY